jgi:hypothetical protein
MKTYGVEITPTQITVGLSAMRGRFAMADVVAALVSAGVPVMRNAAFTPEYVAARTADKLLQRERRAGRIKTDPLNKKFWLEAK